MKNEIKGLRFWVRVWLESIGMTMAVALGGVVVKSLGLTEYTGETENALTVTLALFPYMLIFVGAVMVLIMMLGLFQGYFSLLVSMNVTRSRAIRGIWLNQAAAVLSILLLASLIWQIVPGELTDAGLSLLPLFAGILFGAAAIGMVLGTAMLRWGRAGVVIAVLLCMVIGGLCGALTAVTGNAESMTFRQIFVEKLPECNFWPVALGCIIFYLAVGVFALAVTRKAEVRV